MKYIASLALFSLILAACSFKAKQKSSNKEKEQISTFFIAPYKVDCMGIAPMKCLLVRKSDTEQWENFYSSIKGFDFIPGNQYQLKVRIIRKENAPADASSFNYELIEIISKETYAPHSRSLFDIWGVVDVKGDNPLHSDCEQTLEINMTENIIMGKGGCNNFRGKIELISGTNQIKFTKVLSSRRTCANQTLEDKYLQALNSVDAYFRFNQHLYLISEDEVIIKCKRMD
ncbi:DUF4377 domain-containing protein [Carboxylicivirga marina]|uniref:DUF4377 domain-containing protein n=1 Tax=Carboxylicivirga marina TaxID=2800988 RepID=A0ABS1HM49_9BACT|nr:DUF4377 domain-containing protein [Carboxylicivirga marina]MBK3518701.1 DUF4377 domain-containing protein [Carboxylicivirga marina]